MGAEKLAPWLTEYAQSVPSDRAIVEVGAWLGAGTRYLVRENAPLYVYDGFQANHSEVEKAAKFGVKLEFGQDTLPWVQAHLPQGIHFIKGNLKQSRYNGPEIGLYVDDASKAPKLWRHSMETFEPYFVKGSVIMLMDYHFPPCTAQRQYARKWQVMVEHIHGTSCAVFRC
jgi:hypothetical protein